MKMFTKNLKKMKISSTKYFHNFLMFFKLLTKHKCKDILCVLLHFFFEFCKQTWFFVTTQTKGKKSTHKRPCGLFKSNINWEKSRCLKNRRFWNKLYSKNKAINIQFVTKWRDNVISYCQTTNLNQVAESPSTTQSTLRLTASPSLARACCGQVHVRSNYGPAGLGWSGLLPFWTKLLDLQYFCMQLACFMTTPRHSCHRSWELLETFLDLLVHTYFQFRIFIKKNMICPLKVLFTIHD